MLTDTAIRALRPEAKPIKRADGGGLFIQVMPGGGKHWRLAYRFAGKQKLLSGGPYPIVKLTDARKWRDEAKAQLLAGRDPSAVRKAEKRAIAAASESAFEKVAREWLSSRKAAWSPRYARIITTRLEQDIFPHLGTVPIAEIDPPMILAALRKIEARGSIEMAHRIRNHVGEVFRFGIATERCRSDPSRDIAPAMMRPPPVKHRAKVEARDLPAFFAKLARDEGEPMSHLALRWTILTMVRSQETRFAEWSEFEGLESEQALWRIVCLLPGKQIKVDLSALCVGVERLLRQAPDDLCCLWPYAWRLAVDDCSRHLQRTVNPLWDIDAELCQQPADHVHQLRALLDQQIARPVHRQGCLLLP